MSLLLLLLSCRCCCYYYYLLYREFISSHPNNIDTIVKRLMINELGQTTRSSTNMQLLVMAIHEKPDKAATVRTCTCTCNEKMFFYMFLIHYCSRPFKELTNNLILVYFCYRYWRPCFKNLFHKRKITTEP